MSDLSGLKTIFDRIYVINLADRADRRREMSDQLQRVGLSFDDDYVQLFSANKPDTPDVFPSVGARGCFMSHLEIIEQAVTDGHHSILILEDDVNWTRAAMEAGNDIVAAIATTDWTYLHGGVGKDAQDPGKGFHLRRLEPDQGMPLAHFVGLRGDAIATAHRYLSAMLGRPPGSPEGGPMHVDGAYTWLRKDHSDIESYVCVPSIAKQRPSLSDITPPTGIKALPIIRQALAILRSLRKKLI